MLNLFENPCIGVLGARPIVVPTELPAKYELLVNPAAPPFIPFVPFVPFIVEASTYPEIAAASRQPKLTEE
jgi:hypothetical protein